MSHCISTAADVIEDTVCVFPSLQMSCSANQTHEEFLEALNTKVTKAVLNEYWLSMLQKRLEMWMPYDTKCGIFSGATEEEREWVLEELKATMRFAVKVHDMMKYNSGHPFRSQDIDDIDERKRMVEQYETFDKAKTLLMRLDPDWAKSVNADHINNVKNDHQQKCCLIL